MKKAVFLGLISILIFSCNQSDKLAHINRAFYYWKSEYTESSEMAALQKYQTHTLYVKYFEIDYSEAMGNYPLDKTQIGRYENQQMDSVSIVPTIYIKNDIFRYNTKHDLVKLADNIVYLVDKYNKEKFKNTTIASEIQIDCDWTKSTKESYFYLLQKIKEISKRNISCTLRLYPYKYPEIMGTPPVDRVMLMCYNLVKPLTDGDKNSILDLKELESYLTVKKEYPIPMDVALPIYSWTQWYQNNHFSGLLTLGSKEIQSFAKPVKPMWYEVTKDTSMNYETYFRKGDQLKCEEIDAKLVEDAIQLIKKKVVLHDNCTIALFHLDQSILNQFTHEEINGFYTAFTK
jgi:hypothetical protein